MKRCSKILIVLAVVNIIGCRPPQMKEIKANKLQNTGLENQDSFDLRVTQGPISTKSQETAIIIDPHQRQPLRSVDQVGETIGGRPKEIKTIQDVIHTHTTPTKNRVRRHRRSTDLGTRWTLLKGNVSVIPQVCDKTSAQQVNLQEEYDLNLQQEYLKFLLEDKVKFEVPVGCKILTKRSRRVCKVLPEMAVEIQQDPPLKVFKRICQDPGLINSAEIISGDDNICEQKYLDVRLANQTDIRVESGCDLKFIE